MILQPLYLFCTIGLFRGADFQKAGAAQTVNVQYDTGLLGDDLIERIFEVFFQNGQAVARGLGICPCVSAVKQLFLRVSRHGMTAASTIDFASQNVIGGFELGAAKAAEALLDLIEHFLAYDGGMMIWDLDPFAFVPQPGAASADL